MPKLLLVVALITLALPAGVASATVPETTTVPPPAPVVVEGLSDLSNVITLGLGLLVFASFAALVAGWRHHRA